MVVEGIGLWSSRSTISMLILMCESWGLEANIGADKGVGVDVNVGAVLGASVDVGVLLVMSVVAGAVLVVISQ